GTAQVNLVLREDAGAADAGHEDARGARNFEGRLGILAAPLERLARLLPRLALRNDGEERGAVAAQARVVLVARGLVDLRLAAELGLHRLDRQAVRLLPAVTATLADRLVDVHAERRTRDPTALAHAALLGRAALAVDEHG